MQAFVSSSQSLSYSFAGFCCILLLFNLFPVPSRISCPHATQYLFQATHLPFMVVILVPTMNTHSRGLSPLFLSLTVLASGQVLPWGDGKLILPLYIEWRGINHPSPCSAIPLVFLKL